MLKTKTIKEDGNIKIFSDVRPLAYMLISMDILVVLLVYFFAFVDSFEKDKLVIWTVGLIVAFAVQCIFVIWSFWKIRHGAIVLNGTQRKLEFSKSFSLQIPQSTFSINDVSQISLKPTSTQTNQGERTLRIVLKVRTGEEKTLDLNFPEKEATQTAKTIGEFFGVPAYDSENDIIFSP